LKTQIKDDLYKFRQLVFENQQILTREFTSGSHLRIELKHYASTDPLSVLLLDLSNAYRNANLYLPTKTAIFATVSLNGIELFAGYMHVEDFYDPSLFTLVKQNQLLRVFNETGPTEVYIGYIYNPIAQILNL